MSHFQLADWLFESTDAYTRLDPFLLDGISGRLTEDRLAFWIFQDILLNAHAYPRFIGALIAKIPFSEEHLVIPPEEQDRREIWNTKILNYLKRFLKDRSFWESYFEVLADFKPKLDMNGWTTRKATRDYMAEMSRVTNGSFEEGLVFLWAMEKVFSIHILCS